MIDLTPLDVRNKRGDFKKLMRGYDPQEVDVFLELVAERLEALVRENIQLRDRTTALQVQVEAQTGREQAVQDALVTAQELRKDIREQSQREADHIMREAEGEARRMITEAEAEVRSRLRGVQHRLDESRDSLEKLERRRQRFLHEFRGLLQRELDVVQVEEERVPLEERTVDLELGGHRGSSAMGSPGAGLVGEGSPVVDEAFPAVDEVTSEVEDPGAEADDASPGVEETSDEADHASHGVEESPDEASLVEDGSGTVELVDFSGDEYDRASAPESADSSEEADEVTPEPPTEPASNGSESGDGKEEARPEESPPVDVADLGPKAMHAADGAAAPPTPTVASEPSSLELELMASATPEALSGDYPEVPDLETVLAEAGIDEVRPPADEEISPPPASRNPSRDDARRPEDRLVFDKDKKGRQG